METSCVEESCPVARAMEVLDGKWTVLVIRDLLAGVRRFSQLRSSLSGISPKTLTDRLRLLEEHGLVRRTVYAEVPPRVEYELTARCRPPPPPADRRSRHRARPAAARYYDAGDRRAEMSWTNGW
jgi:DNA-binding HxlR family transcriptional regulator